MRMSETTSKKNSIFDKVLLGVAGVLAIGMLAFGAPEKSAPSPEKEEVAEQEGGQPAAPEKSAAKTKADESAARKKLAEVTAALAKAKQENKDLNSKIRARNLALEMKGGDAASILTNGKELKKAKAELEAKQVEVKKLKDRLAKVTASESKGDEMSEIAAAKKAAEAELKRKMEAIEIARKALEEAVSGK